MRAPMLGKVYILWGLLRLSGKFGTRAWNFRDDYRWVLQQSDMDAELDIVYKCICWRTNIERIKKSRQKEAQHPEHTLLNRSTTTVFVLDLGVIWIIVDKLRFQRNLPANLKSPPPSFAYVHVLQCTEIEWDFCTQNMQRSNGAKNLLKCVNGAYSNWKLASPV